ncbi:MAG: sporulation protein YqfD, partial [Oscillospiraceae bacterium]|nr:sporulation protein YqfD [Oscillospiraceae bacterium]
MISLYGLFSGTVSFSVRFPPDSDNSADLIGRLVRSVGFARVRSEKGTVYGTVKRTELPRVCRIARSLGAEAEITGTNGLYYILQRYSKRIGIPVGAFIAAVILLYLSNIVLKIEISGNEEAHGAYRRREDGWIPARRGGRQQLHLRRPPRGWHSRGCGQ